MMGGTVPRTNGIVRSIYWDMPCWRDGLRLGSKVSSLLSWVSKCGVVAGQQRFRSMLYMGDNLDEQMLN